MSYFIIVIAILIIVSNLVKKKKIEEHKRQQAEANAGRQARMLTPEQLDQERRRAAEIMREARARNPGAIPGAAWQDPGGWDGEGSMPEGDIWGTPESMGPRPTAPSMGQFGPAAYQSGEGAGTGDSMPYASGEGTVASGSMQYVSSEGMELEANGQGVPGEGEGAPRLHRLRSIAAEHVVKPLTESSHGHVEESITGITECEVEEFIHSDSGEDAYDEQAKGPELPMGMGFNRDAMVQAIVFSEILGKPRALRRHGV